MIGSHVSVCVARECVRNNNVSKPNYRVKTKRRDAAVAAAAAVEKPKDAAESCVILYVLRRLAAAAAAAATVSMDKLVRVNVA